MLYTYDKRPDAEQAQRHFEQKAIIRAGEVNAKHKHKTHLFQNKAGIHILLTKKVKS